jgi:hypothetical protein
MDKWGSKSRRRLESVNIPTQGATGFRQKLYGERENPSSPHNSISINKKIHINTNYINIFSIVLTTVVTVDIGIDKVVISDTIKIFFTAILLSLVIKLFFYLYNI